MIIPHTTDYTDKDFDALRLRLRNLVRSVFPEWTDFNAADFGNILLELFANVGDVLTFYQDNQARQSRITTATQRRALLGLVRLIGYTPSSATAATADLDISLPVAAAGDVLIPAGTFAKTAEVTEPARYQLLEDVFIPAGALTGTGSAENSEPRSRTYASSGLPNQVFLIPSTPYLDGSMVISAGNGEYTQVVNFLDSGAGDRHFTVSVDQNDRATVRFGNGISGAIPAGTITFDCKVGGGAAGRVEQNRLKTLEGSFFDSLGNAVYPLVNNPEPSSGGTDRQSVAQIKERGPATLRVLTRTVSREDYEINALRLADVARALMLTRNEDPGIAENFGELYIVPVGGGLASQALKDAVLNQVTTVYPKTITFGLTVLDAPRRDFNFNIIVFFRQGANRATVAANIRAALADYFRVQNADGTSNPSIDFGGRLKNGDGVVNGEFPLSDLENVVRDVVGVRKLGAAPSDFLVNGEHADIVLLPREFPRLGNVVITDGDTGASL